MQRFFLLLMLGFLMMNTASSQDLEVDFSAASTVSQGGTVTIDVSVSNFDRLISAQFSINWDATVMSFSDITNITSDLVSFNATNIGTPTSSQGVEDGQLRFSWSASNVVDLTNGVSIPDGTVLFSFILNGDGAACSEVNLVLSDNPLTREVADVDLNVYTAITDGVNIMVEGTDCMGGGGSGADGCAISGNTNGVGFIIQELSGQQGAEVCVQVSVDNWTNIQSAQSGITWDSSILTLSGTQSYNLPGLSANSFISNSPGELRFIWFDNTGATPSTLADGDVIFDLCFTLTGSEGSASDILIVSLPSFSIEVADSNQNSLDVYTDCGEIAISGGNGGGGNNSDGCAATGDMTGVGLLTVEMSATMGSNICIPVSVANFNDIQSAQSGMSWDPTMFSFTGTQNYNPDFTGLNMNSFNTSNASNGELRFIWFDNTGVSPVNLADGTVIFELCFDVIGSCNQFSDILFEEFNNFSIEFSNSEGSTLPYFTDCGELVVGCGNEVDDISFIVEEAMGSTGSESCVNFFTSDFVDISSIQMNIQWDASVISYNSPNIQCRNADMGITAANFNFIDNNKLRLSWSSSSGGSTLDDSVNGNQALMFCVCYDVIGCSETENIISDIEIVSDADVMIEVGNSDSESVPVIVDNGSITIASSSSCNGPTITVVEITSPVCFGGLGSVQVDVSGTDVMCNWDNNGASSNCNLIALAGEHTLVVTDASGLTTSTNVTITQPDEIMVSTEVVDESCSGGGSITITPSGGAANYSVIWTGGPSCSPNACVGTSLTDLTTGTYIYTVTDDNDCSTTGEVLVGVNSDVPVITESVKPIDCDGLGSITLTSSINPITVEWTPTGIGSTLELVDLPVGIYAYVVTDAATNCTSSGSIEITSEVDAFSVTTSTSDVTCNGGEDGVVNFEIMGGCPDYELTINYSGAIISGSSISNLPAGTYEVSVIDKSNPANINTSIITISEPDALVFALEMIVPATAAVNDGAINASTTGGTPPYNYEWSGGSCDSGCPNAEDISALSSDTYFATVTDANNCTAVISATGVFVPGENDPPSIVIDVISATDFGGFGVSCPGLTGEFCNGSINGTFTGLAGAVIIDIFQSDGSMLGSYDAFPIDGLCAGTYSISVTDTNSNTAMSMFEISEPTAIVIETVDFVRTPPGSIDINVTGGVAPYTFLWNAPLNAATEDVSNLPFGTYSVFVTDANNCTQLSDNYVVMDSATDVCYSGVPIITPNGDGINDTFFITCANNNTSSINLYDRWGKLVFSDALFNLSNSWGGVDENGNLLNEGAYYWVLQVTLGDGSTRLYRDTVTLLRE